MARDKAQLPRHVRALDFAAARAAEVRRRLARMGCQIPLLAFPAAPPLVSLSFESLPMRT